jgi:ribonuclease H2 subunit C
MLSITSRSPSSPTPKITPNILPCRIEHNGPANTSKRYWNPQPPTSPSQPSISHFRGRELKGRTMAVPEGYRGVVLCGVEKAREEGVRAEAQRNQKAQDRQDYGEGSGEEDDVEEPMHEGTVVEKAEFERIVVWSHEQVADPTDDIYWRGVEEWVPFAEAVSSSILSGCRRVRANC